MNQSQKGYDDSPALRLLLTFLLYFNPAWMRSELRRCVTVDQLRQHALGAVLAALAHFLAPTLRLQNARRVARFRRGGIVLALALVLVLVALYVLPESVFTHVLGIAAVVLAWAAIAAFAVAILEARAPGYPDPVRRDAVREAIDQAEKLELNHATIGPVESVITASVVTAEIVGVFVLESSAILSSATPAEAAAACSLLGIVLGLALYEVAVHCGKSWRKASIHGQIVRQRESTEPETREKGKAKQKAYAGDFPGGIAGNSRIVGFGWRTRRGAIVWTASLVALFSGTMALRLFAALGSPEALLGLILTACVSAATLALAVFRAYAGSVLNPAVAEVQLLATRFPTVSAYDDWRETERREVTGRLQGLTTTYIRDWEIRFVDDDPLQIDLVQQFNERLAAELQRTEHLASAAGAAAPMHENASRSNAIQLVLRDPTLIPSAGETTAHAKS